MLSVVATFRNLIKKVRTVSNPRVTNLEQLREELAVLRARLASAFSPQTAAFWHASGSPSAGHCAAVAVLIKELFGGETVSARVHDESHWFNRIKVAGEFVDIDLTGDQFGLPSLQLEKAGLLYEGTRVRAAEDVRPETLERAALLAQRAGLRNVARAIAAGPASRSGISGG